MAGGSCGYICIAARWIALFQKRYYTSSSAEVLFDPLSSLKLHKTPFFVESRGIYIHKGIEHLQSLQDIKIKDDVHQILINDSLKGLGTDEASLFLYDKIPALKYSNPDVSIVCTRDESKPWEVTVTLTSGDKVPIATEGKTAEKILEQLCDVVAEKT